VHLLAAIASSLQSNGSQYAARLVQQSPKKQFITLESEEDKESEFVLLLFGIVDL
jgi:hypothetical protein